MTTVGKIFVFLNLFFSFVVGFLGILNYAARTHWAAGYEDLMNKYKVLDASRLAYKADAEKVAADATAQREKLGAQIAQLQADLRNATEQNLALNNKLQQTAKQVNQHEAVVKGSQVEVERRSADVEHLRKNLKEEADRNTELVKERNKERDRAVEASIKLATVIDTNQRLEGQLRKMATDIARLQAGRGSTAQAPSSARGKNPPPESIEGLIRSTDPSSGLVTLTIGSDAGLARGQTLEVFRLSSIPSQSRYLGTIRILEATANQAVGEPVGRMVAPPQPGDRVASRILGD